MATGDFENHDRVPFDVVYCGWKISCKAFFSTLIMQLALFSAIRLLVGTSLGLPYCLVIDSILGSAGALLWTHYIWKWGTLEFEVAIRAVVLSCLFALGLVVTVMTNVPSLGGYMMALSFFHWSEYVTQSVFNPRSTTIDSYMMSHSTAYQVAALVSWLELALEMYLFPDKLDCRVITWAGAALVIGGEGLRKTAMVTARSNFNHYVQFSKSSDHQLVTWGVYGYSRHPSYVGWFMWSLGTQLLLVNPVCLVAYAVASWKFFKGRVEIEEETLIGFFGEEYIEYQKRVGTGLPFINGLTTLQHEQEQEHEHAE